MRARADGADDFFWLGGSENEDQVLWGFLHNLQQGVEALGGDHVGFVDNEDAVAGFRRGVCGTINSTTSRLPGPPGASDTHELHTPQGVDVGPCTQLRDRAKIRADDVLPHPRGPVNK